MVYSQRKETERIHSTIGVNCQFPFLNCLKPDLLKRGKDAMRNIRDMRDSNYEVAVNI